MLLPRFRRRCLRDFDDCAYEISTIPSSTIYRCYHSFYDLQVISFLHIRSTSDIIPSSPIYKCYHSFYDLQVLSFLHIQAISFHFLSFTSVFYRFRSRRLSHLITRLSISKTSACNPTLPITLLLFYLSLLQEPSYHLYRLFICSAYPFQSVVCCQSTKME